MYSKQESSQLRQMFWTAFGKYMQPVPDAWGDKVNWINYKTGIKHIFFKMNASNKQASVGIYVSHADVVERQLCYEQLLELKPLFNETIQEEWNWQKDVFDEHGNVACVVLKTIDGVNIFNQETWPDIISFLKPRIIALDAFWQLAKPAFE